MPSMLPTSGILNGPMTVAIAVLGEEDVSPMMACTCAAFIHEPSEVEDTLLSSFVKASATFTLLAMEPQVS